MAINPISTVPQEILNKIYSFLDFNDIGIFASVCRTWNAVSKTIEQQDPEGAKNILLERKLRNETHRRLGYPSHFAKLVSFLKYDPPSPTHPFFAKQSMKNPKSLCRNIWRFFYIKDPTTILGVNSQFHYPLYLKLEENAPEQVVIKQISCTCKGNFVFALCSNGKIIQWDYCFNKIVQIISTQFTDKLVEWERFLLFISNNHIILVCGKLVNRKIEWAIEVISLDSLEVKFSISLFEMSRPKLCCFEHDYLYCTFGDSLHIYNKKNEHAESKCTQFLLGSKWLFHLYEMQISLIEKGSLKESVKGFLEFPPAFVNSIKFNEQLSTYYNLFEYEKFLICITDITNNFTEVQRSYFTIWNVDLRECMHHGRYHDPKQIIDILEPPQKQEITIPSLSQMVASIREFCISLLKNDSEKI